MEKYSFIPGEPLSITPQMKESFEMDGYILIRFVVKKYQEMGHHGCIKYPQHAFSSRSLLTSEELSRLNEDIQRDNGIIQHSFVVPDGHGRNSRMCLWNHPGNDITGMVGRCQKVAGTMEQLLGGEVYHYHTKLMMKEAHTGGSFVWHQDYG